jgi:hypothetical protein
LHSESLVGLACAVTIFETKSLAVSQLIDSNSVVCIGVNKGGLTITIVAGNSCKVALSRENFEKGFSIFQTNLICVGYSHGHLAHKVYPDYI